MFQQLFGLFFRLRNERFSLSGLLLLLNRAWQTDPGYSLQLRGALLIHV